jgi:hypothetical protein
MLIVNPAGLKPAVFLGDTLWSNLPLAASAVGAGIVIRILALSDWNRVYKELWMNRDG